MYKIGDNVVYGSNGVMTVTDIREECIGDAYRSYYVLRPYGSEHASFTFVPTDSESLVSQMLPLLTKDEIYAMLRDYSSIPGIEWIKENRQRSEYFKNLMESGDRARILVMIDEIVRAGLKRQKEGKKNFLSDENAMRKAEKIISLEFSLVLGIPEDAVFEFIRAEIAKNK